MVNSPPLSQKLMAHRHGPSSPRPWLQVRDGLVRQGGAYEFETESNRIVWRGVPPPPPSPSGLGMGWYVAPRQKENAKKRTEEAEQSQHQEVFLPNPAAQAPAVYIPPIFGTPKFDTPHTLFSDAHP